MVANIPFSSFKRYHCICLSINVCLIHHTGLQKDKKKLIENVTFSYQICLWPQSCSIHTCHRGCGCWPRMLPIDFWFLSASFLSVYLCMHVYSPFYTRQTGVSMLCVHVHSCLHLHPLPCTDSLHSSILFHLISLTHALFMIYRILEFSHSCHSLGFLSF